MRSIGSLFMGIALAVIISFNMDQWRLDYIHYKADKATFLLTSPVGSATGFLIQAPSGKVYLMTAAHVCIGLIPPNEWVRISPQHDVCVAKARLESIVGGYKVLKPASTLENFQRVYILGHPLGQGLTLTEGTVAGKIMFNDLWFNAVTAVAYPGNSGSPVLDKYGNVVGILVAGLQTTTRNVTVPIEDVSGFLKGL